MYLVAIAVAIAIHNIPEGIATSVPIYYSTGSRKRAFIVSFFSGITEPLGAIIGYLILRPFFNDVVFGILFGIIAGIMVFISIEELLNIKKEWIEIFMKFLEPIFELEMKNKLNQNEEKAFHYFVLEK